LTQEDYDVPSKNYEMDQSIARKVTLRKKAIFKTNPLEIHVVRILNKCFLWADRDILRNKQLFLWLYVFGLISDPEAYLQLSSVEVLVEMPISESDLEHNIHSLDSKKNQRSCIRGTQRYSQILHCI